MTTDAADDVGVVPARLVAAHGACWAARAHQSATDLARRWALSLGAPLTGGMLSLCLDARTECGHQVVLKVPAAPAVGRLEADALALFPAGAVPEMLATDTPSGSFLMEYVEHTGAPLNPVAAHRLARALHTAPLPDSVQHRFPTLTGNLDTRMAEAHRQHANDPALSDAHGDPDRARALLDRLLADGPDPVLLHGDFQDKNVLVDGRGNGTAIDPMPCVGDPAFDVALWVATRRHHQVSIADTLACLGSADENENARLAAWTWCLAVLESRSRYPATWAWQREFVTAYRHLAQT